MAVTSTTSGTGAPLTVDELLARSSAAVATKGKGTGSKISQMLAGREEGDTVTLSPVQKLEKAKTDAAAKQKAELYTEQEWYIRAKVAYLRAQIDTFSSLPGLDPSGAVMKGLTAEVTDLVQKQQARLKESVRKGEEAQAKLAEQARLKALEPPSAETLLQNSLNKVNGVTPTAPVSKAVQALLDKSLGAVVDKTA